MSRLGSRAALCQRAGKYHVYADEYLALSGVVKFTMGCDPNLLQYPSRIEACELFPLKTAEM